ncbi:MAG: YyaL domain-containing protein, partial [Candidatus Xenobia bacterium]
RATCAGSGPPPRWAWLLPGVIDAPTPGPSVTGVQETVTIPPRGTLSQTERKKLESLIRQRYDNQLGGWGDAQKFLNWDNVEWCMQQARKQHDRDADHMARQTLDLQFKLIDPVWGGVDQYSDSGDWDHPHFEKIMQFQANNIRIYSLAYAQYHDARYLQAAEKIRGYLKHFLTSPDGAFYVSQDADLKPGEHSGEYYKLDDAARRDLGVPRVDQHIYARENGWAIQALCALYAVSGDSSVLADAQRAATWIEAWRRLPGGGYRHDRVDSAGPYLGDTLAMGQAWLSLYEVTADRADLAHAQAAADFIRKNFSPAGTVGLVTAVSKSRFNRWHPQADENVAAVRFANLLSRYTGKPEYRKLAEQSMRYLAAPEIAEVYSAAGILLADTELHTDPTHLTIVGRTSDPDAHALLLTALGFPGAYKRVEWLDRQEGPLPNGDVEYPDMKRAAAYVCSDNRCSRPAFTPDALKAIADRLLH